MADQPLRTCSSRHSVVGFCDRYRLLGSTSDAEDVAQDTHLRWRRVFDVRDAESYLVRVVTRRCPDRLVSARARRELYVGPWLPEPSLTGPERGAAGDR